MYNSFTAGLSNIFLSIMQNHFVLIYSLFKTKIKTGNGRYFRSTVTVLHENNTYCMLCDSISTEMQTLSKYFGFLLFINFRLAILLTPIKILLRIYLKQHALFHGFQKTYIYFRFHSFFRHLIRLFIYHTNIYENIENTVLI